MCLFIVQKIKRKEREIKLEKIDKRKQTSKQNIRAQVYYNNDN